MATAQRYDEADDRKLIDVHETPAVDPGSANDTARGDGAMAPQQSLAEIGFLYNGYSGPEAEMCVEPELATPNLDQLSLHGVAPEPTHVDPAATAVAQAELETGTAAPAAKDEHAEDTGADGPEAGTVQNAPAKDEGTHDGVPASPAAVLSGAAQGLTTIAETAAPGAKPAGPAAAATTAPAPAAAEHEGQAASAQTWQDRARVYNQRHGMVEQFNAATGNACGTGGDADPNAIAAWQSAHGLHPDGRIGHLTLGAAAKPAAAKAEAHTEAHNEAPHAEAPHAEAPHKPAAPAPVAPATVTAAPTTAAPAAADSFTGTDDLKGAGKDRWTSYGKGDNKTSGWDLGGTHGAKSSGGDAGAAIYAVSNVEGRYDSVQTYDAGILSFGIMQWTLHAGSLQKFLGFLKDKSGPEGRAAFQDDFAAKGIDVKPNGGQYQLWYNGKEYPLGDDGEGKAAIDKLVRDDKTTARKWAEIFSAAGADTRVQKAQFERAKEMFKEAQGLKFSDKVVEQSLKACKNTFHAKYRDQYGKAETWMTASPKAAALFFSMRVNNPKYANAAFLKAIDAFYDAHGTDRTKWPAAWGEEFGNLVATKSKETLSNWGTENGGEGRVDKTLRFWNKAHDHAAPAATTTATTAPATKPAAPIAAKADTKAEAKAEAAPDAGRMKKLRGQYAALMKQFLRGQIDQAEAVKKLITFDQKLHGGTPSLDGLMLLPLFMADLLKATIARSAATAPATPVATKPTAPAVTKTPAQTPTTEKPAAKQQTPTTAPPQPTAAGPAISKVYHFNGLPTIRAYLPPGGVKGTVDVFAFFHGMYAHHDAKTKDVDDPERESHMAESVAGSGRNLIALSPAAEMTKGQWPMWASLNKNHGYAQIVEQSLRQLSTDLGTPLTAGTISLAGHSAGGSALGEAAEQLGDHVHDVTLQDGGYGSASFLDSHDKLQHWLLTGKVDKTIRVITHGDPDQVSEGKVLSGYLNAKALEKAAAAIPAPGVTVSMEPGDKDARSVGGMHLHHRLVIHGLPASRTVSVFNFKSENHYEVRNKTMGHLIQEGPNTDFVATGAAKQQGPADTHGTTPQIEPKHHATTTHAEPKAADPKAKTEAKTEAKHAAAEQPTMTAAAATADLHDLDALVASAHNPAVSAAAQHLHDLAAKFAAATTSKAADNNEIKGDSRGELVKGIAALHAEIAALDHAGLEQPKLDPIKTRMFRALQEISPYHSQGRNVDILERGEKERARAHAGGIKTRTCNITSLSMALEGLGKSAADYSGNRDVILAAAKEFHPELKAAELKASGAKDDWGQMEALRLPDFMELAAIAELAKGKTDSASIMAAASDAFDQILMMGFLGTLATRFGASADLRYFSYDGKQTHTVEKKGKTREVGGTVEADKLGSASKEQRHDIDALIDARNAMEASTGDAKKHAKAEKKYEELKAHSEHALSGKSAEANVPLEAFKKAVTEQLGAELASGAAIETHVIGHFVRLRAIYPDHVVIDDPATFGRAYKKVLWDEARAQGMFDRRLVIR